MYGFLALATLSSLGLIPDAVGNVLAALSSWALLAAIAAVGMKTDLRNVVKVGGGAIALIVGETVFLAALVLGGLYAFGIAG
ncbi:MAG: putative sulfate exporter family transporter [Paracoccaceae bacterium]